MTARALTNWLWTDAGHSTILIAHSEVHLRWAKNKKEKLHCYLQNYLIKMLTKCNKYLFNYKFRTFKVIHLEPVCLYIKIDNSLLHYKTIYCGTYRVTVLWYCNILWYAPGESCYSTKVLQYIVVCPWHIMLKY